ncbi:MAG: hypothetical protein LBN27_13230 [Prevotellaceae bacterium]|jgi:hypothetical protein|nr:hypothetical protein [Prevotellaceae bacterium]
MEGRHLAVIGATGIWCIVYCISLYCLWFLFSKGIKQRLSSKKTTTVSVMIALIAALLLAPLLSGVLFRYGVILEKGNGIAWGCYLEHFFLAALILFSFSFLLLIIVIIIALIKPQWFKFQKRINILCVFILQNIFAGLLPFCMEGIVRKMLASASGINSTCL